MAAGTEHAEQLRTALARREIAQELLLRQVGDRIATVAELSQRCRTGHGTIQAALAELQESGAVRLRQRGHLGTFIEAMDRAELRRQAGMVTLYGLMPLPYSRSYEGLATGLYENFQDQGFRFSLGYMRGASERWQAVAEGKADFAVMSLFAFERLAARQGGELIHVFPPGTYVSAHVIFFSCPGPRGIENGMRVGIDRSSADQAELTLAECEGKRVELVETPYMTLLEGLRAGKLDAAVWSADDRALAPALPHAPLQSPRAVEMQGKNTAAAIVALAERRVVTATLRDLLLPKLIAQVREQVMSGARVPRY